MMCRNPDQSSDGTSCSTCGAVGTGTLHERLKRALRAAIRSGRLATGATLPPSRALAADLGCSRWAVTEAYAQLTAEGYLEARTGSGTRVRWVDTGHAADVGAPRASRPSVRMDLAPGLPDLRAFPRARWAAALRTVTANAAVTDLGYAGAVRASRAAHRPRRLPAAQPGRDRIRCPADGHHGHQLGSTTPLPGPGR